MMQRAFVIVLFVFACRFLLADDAATSTLLAEAEKLKISDAFTSGQANERWFFNKDWSVEGDSLQRSDEGSDTTRIFLKDAKFRDVVIRFDFQLQQSQDLRLVTGSGGNYNAVIHIRPDHFYVQTALDKTGPYFSYRHGECAFEFERNKWYTMTIEFLRDQLVAHIDRDHLVFAKHPILDKERKYFAFQVDASPAAIDNVEIFTAVPHQKNRENLAHILSVANKHLVEMSVSGRFAIQKTNAHEWLYQRDEKYRSFCRRVDELDKRNKALYPDVFKSHKEFQKQISAERKRLHTEDPNYKSLLFATFRAKREIEAYLVAQDPEVAELPDSRRKRAMEQLRLKHKDDLEFKKLTIQKLIAQEMLEKAYPQLFVSNEEISAIKKQNRQKVQDDPAFKKAVKERGDAWRAQQDYLFTNDKELAELQRQLDETK